jgi:hypothetical protein
MYKLGKYDPESVQKQGEAFKDFKAKPPTLMKPKTEFGYKGIKNL